MKGFAISLLLVSMLFAVPALSQGDGDAAGLAARVKALEADKKANAERVTALEKQSAAQQKAIDALKARVVAEQKAGAQLAKRLKKARKDGFTYPAPNIDAREGLLKGLDEFAAHAAK
ncbi:MAG: hypothetical protein ACYTGZ_08775 [Planctomycetota bacterium]|jgi:uncharacterized coiled-coil protein SlyX